MEPFDIEKAKIGAEKIAKKYGLSFVALFGSQATGRTHAKSDIDIGVAKRSASYFEEAPVSLIEIESEMTRLFNRDDIEVVNLSAASPALLRSVVQEGKVLYEASPDEFFEWKLFAIRVWMDTKWLRDRSRAHIKEWARTI